MQTDKLNEESKLSRLIFYLTLILIGMFSAFHYQEAWGWPVVDTYPLVERMLNSDYLVNDFYTNIFEEFSPRLYLAYLYLFGADLFNIDYTIFVGYLNVLRIFLYSISLYVLFRVLSRNRYIALIGTFIGSVSFHSIPKVIGWNFSNWVLIGSEISMVLIIFGLALIYKSKITLGLLLFSIAMVVHPVITIHGLTIAGILYLAKNGFSQLKRLVTISSIVSFVLLIIAFLASYIPHKLSEQGIQSLSNEEFVYINAILRHSDHYILSAVEPEKWILIILSLATFLYMIYILRNNLPLHLFKFVKYYSAYMGLVLVIGYLFIEVFPIKTIVTLSPYRSFIFFTLFYLFIYSFYMFYKFKSKDYVAFALLHIPFIPVLTDDPELSTTAILIAFMYAIITDILMKKNRRLKLFPDKFNFKKANLKYIYLFLISLAFIGSYLAFNKTLSFDVPDIDEKENEVYLWLNENSPKDSTILSEIKVGNLVNQKIRLLAKRAVPVSKEFPFNGKYYKEWSQRYLEIYNGIIDNKGYIDSLTGERLNQLSEKYHIDYILRTRKLGESEFFKLEKTIQLSDVFGERLVYIYSKG